VESSRYIPRDSSHMHPRNRFGRDYDSKTTTDNAKKRTADAQAKRSCMYSFKASVGQ